MCQLKGSGKIMNKILKNRIIIWGNDNYNVMGLLRQFENKLDVFCIILGKANGCATKSKYCHKYFETYSIQEGYDYLMSSFVSEKQKPIIITPSDEIIEFIDLHREDLVKYFEIPGTLISGQLTKYNNKINMALFAEKHGFLVPKFQKCKSDSFLENINFPCILKPTHITIGHKNEFKFKICNNKSELSKILKFVRKNSEFILQEFIPKESVALVYGCRMKNGDVNTAGTLIKDRFINNGDGSHGLITFEYPHGIDCLKIKSFLDEIDYYGLFSFEYGIFNGKAYFFEVNLRNDGTSHYFFQAGANIPLAYVYDIAGLDYSHINMNVNSQHCFIDEIFDVYNIWNSQLTMEKWKMDKNKATIFKYYDEKDLEPWKFVKRYRYKKFLYDYFLKKYRLYVVYLMDKIKK